MKESGKSNREKSRLTGHDRKPISKIWNEYQQQASQLNKAGADVKAIQLKMTEETKYSSSRRTRRKYTPKLDKRLKEIVLEERQKNRVMGVGHKQKLTNKQIHKKLQEEGFNVSEVSVNIASAEIRKKQKEVFIRQSYDPGERLEYDFGEVYLDCGEGMKTCHMAVFSALGANYRWLYLYTNQKKGVFMDSQVRFFEMMGGCCKEIVYDNMRNAVIKFTGKNEKELNPELTKMAMYYGFTINVTNCFKGNEKGHAENSVKVLRNRLFSDKYRFTSLEEARTYAYEQLRKLNENSRTEEEKQHLLPHKPPLELAAISENTVNTSSMICVDTVFYSVPEHLVDKKGSCEEIS